MTDTLQQIADEQAQRRSAAAKKGWETKRKQSKSFTHDMGRLQGSRGQFSNVANHHQGPYKRVLFVCSAGLLRSATAASIFSGEPYNWNTRTVGCNLSYALDPITLPLMEWASVIYCMEQEHVERIKRLFPEEYQWYADKIKVLDIPDHFQYRHPELIKMLKEKLPAIEV